MVTLNTKFYLQEAIPGEMLHQVEVCAMAFFVVVILVFGKGVILN